MNFFADNHKIYYYAWTYPSYIKLTQGKLYKKVVITFWTLLAGNSDF